MGRAIVQVRLERLGGLPEDDCVNSYHFENDGTFETDAPGLADRLETCYQALAFLFGSSLSGNGTIKIYDYADAKPRVPKLEQTFTHGTGGSPAPAEVAVCVSMYAAVAAGENRARRRGRVYLGPCRAALFTHDGVSSDVALPPLMRAQVLDAMEAMASPSAPGAFRLAVFSPTTKLSGGTDDEAWNDVVRLAVDDRADIQRRRGSRPTLREFRDL